MGNSKALCCYPKEKMTVKKYLSINKLTTEFKCELSKDSIFDHYKLERRIGKGHFSEVKMAFKKKGDKRPYAVKILAKQKIKLNKREDFLNELGILKRVDHPNIVRLFEVYEDENFFYLVMEYLSGGALSSKIGDFVENEVKVKDCLHQILCAVNYLHKCKILHRDLKPENIMMVEKDSTQLKIVDFGLAKRFFRFQVLTSFLGTPYFMAPEVIKQKYDEKADIWSVGAIGYIMYTGYPPIDGKDKKDLYKNIVSQKITFDEEEWKNHSKQAKNTVKLMLERNIQKRLTASKILELDYFSDLKEEITAQQDANIIENIRETPKIGRLQLAIGKIAINNLKSDELDKLTRAFQRLDSSRDGFINFSQFKSLFAKEPNTSEEELSEMFANLAQEGKIPYSSFLMGASGMFTAKRSALISSAVSEINGCDQPILTKIKFKQALERGGRTMATNEINSCFEEAEKSNLRVSEILAINNK